MCTPPRTAKLSASRARSHTYLGLGLGLGLGHPKPNPDPHPHPDPDQAAGLRERGRLPALRCLYVNAAQVGHG